MKALLIIANPGGTSFSHALADRAQGLLEGHGHEVVRHDLYAEGFNPVQPTGEAGNRASDDALVERHCRDLAEAGLILVCHPNWWGQPPAILKGWVDRVFRPGVAYDYPPGVGYDGVPVGLLKARAAIVFNTSNTPAERELSVFGDPLETLWKNCVFGLCGVTEFERRVFGPMASSSPEQRQGWLEEAAGVVGRYV